VIDRLIPPHPAHALATGRGGEALVLALVDGQHALAKGGHRWDARGLLALLQPACTRSALPDDWLGHLLDALLAANRHQGCRALALTALEVSAIPTPWRHQDTTPLAL
jgi:hypothetical protein